jgi:hypothetical protein
VQLEVDVAVGSTRVAIAATGHAVGSATGVAGAAAGVVGHGEATAVLQLAVDVAFELLGHSVAAAGSISISIAT